MCGEPTRPAHDGEGRPAVSVASVGPALIARGERRQRPPCPGPGASRVSRLGVGRPAAPHRCLWRPWGQRRRCLWRPVGARAERPGGRRQRPPRPGASRARRESNPPRHTLGAKRPPRPGASRVSRPGRSSCVATRRNGAGYPVSAVDGTIVGASRSAIPPGGSAPPRRPRRRPRAWVDPARRPPDGRHRGGPTGDPRLARTPRSSAHHTRRSGASDRCRS